MSDLLQAYQDYATALRMGDHSLARLAAREYNERLEAMGGPESFLDIVIGTMPREKLAALNGADQMLKLTEAIAKATGGAE